LSACDFPREAAQDDRSGGASEADLSELCFEDVEVGHQIKAGPYPLTEQEMIEFSRRYDPRPFHVDKTAAAHSIFGGLIAAGAHTFAIA
jgi:acyl dehydratase